MRYEFDFIKGSWAKGECIPISLVTLMPEFHNLLKLCYFHIIISLCVYAFHTHNVTACFSHENNL